MPRISCAQMIDISPERFLEACSTEELQEIFLLINSPRFFNKMKEVEKIVNAVEETEDPRQVRFPWWDEVKRLKG